MPFSLFSADKFKYKPGPPRRSPSLSNLNLGASERQAEFGVNYGPVKMNLGGNEVAFEAGEWISESGGGGGNQREVVKLRNQNKSMQEENNLLHIKVEMLLDMLSERTAELHLLENHLNQANKRRL